MVKTNVFEWLIFVIEELNLKGTLTTSEMYPNEIKNLDILLKEAELYNLKGSTLERFAKLGTPEDEVTITTRHSSKGLEFEAVIMLGMEEGKFPFYKHLNDRALLNEDQRLCYVCVSRAKKTCILLRSKKYTSNTQWGLKTFDYAPSRFWLTLQRKFGNQNNEFFNSDL